MSGSSQSSDEENGADNPGDVSRRTVLHGAVGTTALALGVGGVAANGKGGQAFVLVEEFEADGRFEILDGPFTDPDERENFQCGKQGPGISFPYWTFTYEGDDEGEPNKLYTRDNTIDTDVTYRWTNDKPCDDEYRQVGFAVD